MLNNANEDKPQVKQVINNKYQNVYTKWAELIHLEKELKFVKPVNNENESISNTLRITPSQIPQPPFFLRFLFFLIKNVIKFILVQCFQRLIIQQIVIIYYC